MNKNYFTVLMRAKDEIRKSNFELALSLLNPIAEELKLSSHYDTYSRVLKHIGICNYELHRLDQAESAIAEGLRVVKSLRKSINKLPAGGFDGVITEEDFLHELSLIAHKRGKLTEAMRMCKEALSVHFSDRSEARKNYGEERGFAFVVLLELSALLQDIGQTEKSLELLNLLRVNSERSCDYISLAQVYHEFGLALYKINDIPRSLKYFQNSLEIKLRYGNVRGARLTIQCCQTILQQNPDVIGTLDDSFFGVLRTASYYQNVDIMTWLETIKSEGSFKRSKSNMEIQSSTFSKLKSQMAKLLGLD